MAMPLKRHDRRNPESEGVYDISFLSWEWQAIDNLRKRGVDVKLRDHSTREAAQRVADLINREVEAIRRAR